MQMEVLFLLQKMCLWYHFRMLKLICDYYEKIYFVCVRLGVCVVCL